MASFRSFLDDLIKKDELKTITDQVDWDLESSAICAMSQRTGGPAVQFANVKEYPGMPLVGSVFSGPGMFEWPQQKRKMHLSSGKTKAGWCTLYEVIYSSTYLRSKYSYKGYIPGIPQGYKAGMSEDAIGIQEEINYGRSQTLNIIKNLANTGWKGKKISDPYKTFLEAHGGEDGIA